MSSKVERKARAEALFEKQIFEIASQMGHRLAKQGYPVPYLAIVKELRVLSVRRFLSERKYNIKQKRDEGFREIGGAKAIRISEKEWWNGNKVRHLVRKRPTG